MTSSGDPVTEPPVNVLLVDDQPANLLALEAVLDGLGAHLVRAHSGAEALRHVEREDFAAVLLDVRMPGLDGYETARLIRQRDRARHTPILFITAHDTDAPVVAQAYKDGAADHLVKPLVPAVLRAKVAAFVELARKSEAIRRLERQEFERRLAEDRHRAELERLRAEADHARRLAEAQARAERDRLRLAAIVESSDDAIIGKTLDGTITSWNPGAERLYGYAAAEVLGKPVTVLIPPDRPDELPGIMERLRRGERVEPFETVRLTRDGRRVEVSVAVSPIRDEAGRVVGASAIARDITRLRQVEAELRQANEAKDRFLAMLGHELRNPLAPLANALQILRLRGDDPATRAWVGEVFGRQVGQLTRLVDDLLDASRIRTGRVQLRPELLDLAGLVRAAAEDHRAPLEGAGLALAVDVPAAPVWVRGDPARLVQVLGNLLHNAAKFTGRGGRVAVRLGVDEAARRAVVTVSDTGAGIEPGLLPRVFETFAQGDHSLDRTKGGLGLGLALVKGLVEQHGGGVRAVSPGPEGGAEFTFWLPLEAAGPAAAGAAAAPARPREGPLRILVIEDQRDAADSLRLLLELSGHQVAVAATGPEGVETARTFRPDVVLCDVGLPGMDGYAVARRLRQEPGLRGVALVALTGYGRPEDVARAREAGFDHHLTKPADPAELRRVLAAVPPAGDTDSGL